MLMVDAHEDLAMNALPDGRNDLTSARTIRAEEEAAGYQNHNDICMLGLEE